MSVHPHRILVVAMDNLGDLVFTAALPPALRARFPDAEIVMWCKKYTAEIARLIPCVDDVVAADPPWAIHPQHGKPSKVAFVQSVAAVRRRGFDVAVIANAPWRLAFAVRATGIPRRIAPERRHNARFLTDVVTPDSPTTPVVVDHNRLLAPLGAPACATRYALDPARIGPLRGEIARLLPNSFIALHPFAAVAQKRVPLATWLSAARALRDHDVPVVWCGTRAELAELRRADESIGTFIDDLGPGSLSVTAAVLSLAQGFMGHDSGPLHVAGAFGVPVVDVFVGGNPARYGPQGLGPARVLPARVPTEIGANAMLGALGELGLFSAT
jgi:ADP-heptose:LPS heptosyltransferase